MKLKIDAQAVNDMVVDAILKSALGEAVRTAIDREIANINKSHDNPIEAVVRNHVAEIVHDVLVKEYGETILQKASAALAQQLSNDFIDRVCEKAADRYM